MQVKEIHDSGTSEIMRQARRRCAGIAALMGFLALLAQPSAQAQLSLSTVLDMALRNNPKVRMSAADVRRAEAGVQESVDVYKPNLVLGSSLGETYGFPLGQPEVFSLTSQSLAFSFSQRDYVRSARMALRAAELQLADTRQQSILDVALKYLELAKVGRQIAALGQEKGYVERLVEIEQDRVTAGRDSKIDLTKAQLTGAQIQLQRLQFIDRADVLRAELAHLTGLQASDMTPDPSSIPATAGNQPLDGNLSHIDSSVTTDSSSVKAAYDTAKSKLYTAYGDSRQNFRPTVSFVANYGLFASFNNYSQYYLHFQENNFGIGVQIQIPLFNAAHKAQARDSSAQAAHAAAEADQVRNQTSEAVLELQKNMAELNAQVQVAQLQNELARDQLEVVTTQLQSGSGNPQQPPLTPKDEEQARIDERARYVDLLDSKFRLTQAQLTLMRTLGEIDEWAKSAVPLGGAASPGLPASPTPQP